MDADTHKDYSTEGSKLAPGTLFAGQYRIDALLGEGATGYVYAATREIDALQVALKVLHAHLVGDHQVVKRFHREAAVLRRLEGHHIAGLYDFGQTDSGLLYLAQERVPGEPLSEVLARKQELTLDAVRAILLAICDALATAHSAGIIHRDLKPDNVVVKMDGADVEEVWVLDFGMSKVLHGGGPGSTNLTEHNMVLGTPEYMAPEQAKGEEVDERSDIYAAGVILHELLAGTAPFRRRSPLAVMTAHISLPPPELGERPSGDRIPPALAAVASHCMAKRRRDRYQTAEALAAAVRSTVTAPDDTNSVLPPPPPSKDTLPFDDTGRYSSIGHADTVLNLQVRGVTGQEVSPRSGVHWGTLAVVVGAAAAGIGAGLLLAMRC